MEPQGSAVVGRYLVASATAGGLNREGSIRLLPKGSPVAGSVRVRAPAVRHCADSTTLKSPASISAVGTNANVSGGAWRLRVPWYPAKKKSLSRRIGPPIVPP